MNSIFISELILTLVTFFILIIGILYKNCEIRKIEERINYSKEEEKNYELILNKMLNKQDNKYQ